MATEIKTLEPTQRLAITTQPQNYVAAFDNLARSDTLMGDLGATIAQQASIQYNRKMGLEYGLNPQGDLLPPITTADKAFQEGYIAQSKNTLSLQANQMFNQAEEELNKSYKLNQGQINEYQSQMSKGLEGIMKVAPTEVQATLGYQYQAQLQNTTSELRKKLISQSKSEALDTMRVNDKLTDQNINNLATSGKIDQASQIYKNKLAQNQRQYNSGMMTQAEKMASDTSAKITYYQGLYNNQLVNLAQQKKGETKESIDQKRGEFLAQFADYRNRPKDISADEWTTLGNNTLAFEQHLQNMQNIQANFVMSALDVKAIQGTITNLDITSAANTPGVTDTRMNEWMARFKQKQATQNKETALASQIMSDYSNTKLWAETQSDKAKDAAYFQVVNSINQQSGVPYRNITLQPMQAEAQAAAMAGGPVPAFNRVISAYSKSSNPEEVKAAYRAYEDVRTQNPKNIFGLSNDVIQSLQLFGAIKRTNPQMSDDQVVQTMMNVQNRDEAQQKLINQKWQEQTQSEKGEYSTYDKKVKKVEQLLNKGGIFDKKLPLLNKNEIVSNVMSVMHNNFSYAGNLEQAKQMTQDSVDMVYGPSKVNGDEYICMYPLEKMSNLPNSHFFFQKDIVEQTQEKFKAQEEAAKKGIMSYYYRIKNPERFNLETMSESDYQKAIKNTSSIMVETVSIVDGKEKVISESSLIADISQETKLSSDPANPISGDFDLSLVSKTGYPTMLHYYGTYNPKYMTYTPNFQKVKNEFNLMYSKFGSKPMSNTEEIMAYVEKLRGKVELPEININLPKAKERKIDTKKHTYLF